MGGGGGGEGGETAARQLDQTPTWAVGAVCAVIVIISILLEKALHHFGQYFEKRHKTALVEALEKIKSELMVLGFISLLLTFGQSYIAQICIPEEVANIMLPCKKHSHKAKGGGEEKGGEEKKGGGGGHRRLLWNEHRMLAGGGGKAKCHEGHLPLISVDGVHQLHIFIFFLAVFHVIYSAITMLLGRAKIRSWKTWELESANENENSNDPARFRLTHETSFVRDHTSFVMKTPILFHIPLGLRAFSLNEEPMHRQICFYRQFFRSVRRADYLTMRHGFISVHLTPGSKFNFQKYIKRSLEDDFKVIVGISPVLWTSAVIYLTLNVDGWQAMFWLSVMPLVVILSVGTKLQAIISQMAIEITERHAVVQGIPLVQVSDRYFWFSWPRLVLHLIHLTLFQNAFEITYFFWIWYEFGLHSCFHSHMVLQYVRICIGAGILFLCSYITLPLYALVTQMGSTMKKSIFDEHTNKALMSWQKHAMKKKADGKPAPPPTRTLGSPTNSPQDSPVHPHSRNINVDTANIVASVDIPEQNQHPHDNNFGSGGLL